MAKSLKTLFAACFILGSSAFPLGAAIVNVPADQPTVQAGVDAAGPFDTVLVAPGHYIENILITSSIRLASHFFLDGDTAHIAATILDGSAPTSTDTGSVIRIVNGTGTVVQGFTITGGSGTVWTDQADGLDYREGGGILTENGSVFIMNNLIIGNRVVKDDPSIKSAGGGGVRCGYGTAVLTNNVIGYNYGGYGGGIVSFHNPMTLLNNVIYRNYGGQDFGGGGIWITSSGSTNLLENNTFVENSSSLDGGGILLWAAAAQLANNIVCNNQSPDGPEIKVRAAASATVNYSDVGGGWAGTDNLDADPLFETTNYILTDVSPCVDAGNPALSYYDPGAAAATYPARGQRRNDMGAYGGRGCRMMPIFNTPGVGVDGDSLYLDTVEIGDSAVVQIQFSKAAFGVVRIDSIRFLGTFAADQTVGTSFPLLMGPLVEDSTDSIPITWKPVTYGPLDDTVLIYHDDPSVASPLMVHLLGLVPGLTGDPNVDGQVTSADVIYLVNYVFKGGPAPLPVPRSGDVDCTGAITSADVIYMVGYVFKGGPAPCT